MNRSTSGPSLLQWLLAIAGPGSWILVIGLAVLMSGGVDGGWAGMAVMYTGMWVVIPTHLLALVSMVAMAIYRRRRRLEVGRVLKVGLAYYGALAVLALFLMGPGALLRLFGKTFSALLNGL